MRATSPSVLGGQQIDTHEAAPDLVFSESFADGCLQQLCVMEPPN